MGDVSDRGDMGGMGDRGVTGATGLTGLTGLTGITKLTGPKFENGITYLLSGLTRRDASASKNVIALVFFGDTLLQGSRNSRILMNSMSLVLIKKCCSTGE